MKIYLCPLLLLSANAIASSCDYQLDNVSNLDLQYLEKKQGSNDINDHFGSIKKKHFDVSFDGDKSIERSSIEKLPSGNEIITIDDIVKYKKHLMIKSSTKYEYGADGSILSTVKDVYSPVKTFQITDTTDDWTFEYTHQQYKDEKLIFKKNKTAVAEIDVNVDALDNIERCKISYLTLETENPDVIGDIHWKESYTFIDGVPIPISSEINDFNGDDEYFIKRELESVFVDGVLIDLPKT
ncbi:hypothetical protein UA32_12530 [Photobacterium angustum]|uniref:Lipoprotein n=1 Tax=Photobacterium angustum TaxID=661 RepID=A0ABX5H121_PHOAN|nr:hypothetical protein [Photobacterium angustum]KJG37772.1 hypothetical protein UA32_12530 [Photobacterium angustum]PSX07040.1 hypothetical protein C0W27_15845 [Photobacterium angustum]